MEKMSASELVLTPEGRVYHLHLLPEEVATTIFTVGDPGRVELVSRRFDKIEHRVAHREFVTHTGFIGSRRVSVLSTGIGPDNIDIVLNELDALFNVNLKTREVRLNPISLDIIRLGTSGAIQPDLAPGTLVASRMAIGLDNLLFYYKRQMKEEEAELEEAFYDFCENMRLPTKVYFAVPEWPEVMDLPSDIPRGITLTCPGFYGPQARSLRLEAAAPHMPDYFMNFEYKGLRITNIEMESAAIFGLANMLGHRALSINVILANRLQGTFVDDYDAAIDKLIDQALSWMRF